MEKDENKINDIKINESISLNNNSINEQIEINNNNDSNKENKIYPISEENENSDSTNTNNNIIINEPLQQSYIINYFKKIKQFYEKKGYKTEILSELIKGGKNIKFNLFEKKSNDYNWKID